jgi:DNA-binding Lrp family transcriptional regulator
MRAGYLRAAAELGAAVEDLRERMTELSDQGIIHRCPLQLVEVS